MLRTEAVTRIQNGLGFSTALAAQIVLRLQEEQRNLERGETLPKFLLVEDSPLSLLINTNSIALPTDFLRRSNLLPRYTPPEETATQTIPWRNYDEAYETHGAADAAGPKVVVLRKSTLFFLPTADRTYTIYLSYFRKDAILDSDIENLWLANAPELLIGGAGLRIAKDRRDKDAIALFGDMYKQARATWLAENVVQEQDDGPMLLGANA